MKVLLVKDVKKLGWAGDVVDVSTGYARNFLLPQGLVVVPTQENLRVMSQRLAKRAEQGIVERGRLAKAAEAVDGAEAVIAAAANEAGVLFGSVTARQIAENLRQQGFEVTDESVELTEHIKHVGSYSVKLKFGEEFGAAVNVVVVAEKEKGREDGAINTGGEG